MQNEKNHRIINGIDIGDDKIIKEFYQKHLPEVTRYIIKNSGDEFEAKDIFQDAFVIIYEKIKSNDLDIKCSLGTYIYGICKNLWRARLRKNKKNIENESFLLEITDQEEYYIENIDQQETIHLIQKCLIKLGKGCQEILLLFYAGHSMREIAKQKDFTEAYARKRKFICQKKLIEMAEKDPILNELKETYFNK
ncbi:RNA polymerase sigma factor [Aquimarina pacifica]|uniref:RNA polymerase sigma factor n=1 Tax=Aquimarina pacifica TaxID=1296415 RepID=UPI00047103C2|nr:sigma-70 family RNA polymerase sigma factor [Aquimarina pacifica]